MKRRLVITVNCGNLTCASAGGNCKNLRIYDLYLEPSMQYRCILFPDAPRLAVQDGRPIRCQECWDAEEAGNE